MSESLTLSLVAEGGDLPRIRYSHHIRHQATSQGASTARLPIYSRQIDLVLDALTGSIRPYNMASSHRLPKENEMKASELIEALQAMVQEFGDLEVVNDSNEAADVEFNDDLEPAFVVG